VANELILVVEDTIASVMTEDRQTKGEQHPRFDLARSARPARA
jgi:hypothetical protein